MIDKQAYEEFKQKCYKYSESLVFWNGNYIHCLEPLFHDLDILLANEIKETPPVWHSRRDMPDDTKKAKTGDDGKLFYPIVCLIINEDKKRAITTRVFQPMDSPNLEWVDFYMTNRIAKWGYFNDIAPEVKE